MIEALCESEAGTLSGGFVDLGKPQDSEALVNGNCSSGSHGLYNDNCGCTSCCANSQTGGGNMN